MYLMYYKDGNIIDYTFGVLFLLIITNIFILNAGKAYTRQLIQLLAEKNNLHNNTMPKEIG